MRRFLFLVLASGLCAGAASAVPIAWTLQGVALTDGGVASGSFVYDADTNTYSSINITTTAGSVVTTGATYQFLNPGAPDGNTLLVSLVTATGNLTGVRFFDLNFSPALSNLGGSVTVPFGGEGTCVDSGCTAPNFQRQVSAGSVNGTLYLGAIPALSTWGLIGTVLLLGASAFFMLRKNLS